MHFKHPKILRTSGELLRSNVFLQSIIPKSSEMTPEKNLTAKVYQKCIKCLDVFKMQIRELHFYLLTPIYHIYMIWNLHTGTEDEDNAWWMLDLQTTEDVALVRILNRDSM